MSRYFVQNVVLTYFFCVFLDRKDVALPECLFPANWFNFVNSLAHTKFKRTFERIRHQPIHTHTHTHMLLSCMVSGVKTICTKNDFVHQ